MSDEGGLADALITTRDGIVGRWDPPNEIPEHRPPEKDEHLRLWEDWVRDVVFAFEIASRLGFSTVAASGQELTVNVWHLKLSPGTAGGAPNCEYVPLMRLDRPDKQVFADQLALMRAYADLRPDRATEILEELDLPHAFAGSIAGLRPDSKIWTCTLLEVTGDLVRFVAHRVKHALACRRPHEFSPQVQPMIEVPGHGTLPSGHGAEAFAVARVFWGLLRASGTKPYTDPSFGIQLMRLASRMAVNRTVAGVHFPVDTIAGALLGLTLGDYLLARIEPGANAYVPAHFDGAASVGNEDFLWSRLYDVAKDQVLFSPGPDDEYASVKKWGGVQQVFKPASGPLIWLWTRAKGEWT